MAKLAGARRSAITGLHAGQAGGVSPEGWAGAKRDGQGDCSDDGLVTDWGAQGRRSFDQGSYTDSSVKPSLTLISG